MVGAEQQVPRQADRGSVTGATGVALVLVAGGLLFATSAETAHGTQLRPDRPDLVALIRSESTRVEERAGQVQTLRDRVDADTRAAAVGNAGIARLQHAAEGLGAAAGLEPVTGPGLVVTLNDAPRNGPMPPGVKPDDLVVHQQDVQAVVNALWVGGAEAMMLQDQRVISTSAVRCVGNTLILQGRVYSPPFVITAIGDTARMRAALAASPEVQIYREYVDVLGLGWSVRSDRRLSMPGYAGSLDLRYAHVPTAGSTPGPSGTGTPSP